MRPPPPYRILERDRQALAETYGVPSAQISGDGVEDDAPWLRALLDAGAAIELPRGTYLIRGQLQAGVLVGLLVSQPYQVFTARGCRFVLDVHEDSAFRDPAAGAVLFDVQAPGCDIDLSASLVTSRLSDGPSPLPQWDQTGIRLTGSSSGGTFSLPSDMIGWRNGVLLDGGTVDSNTFYASTRFRNCRFGIRLDETRLAVTDARVSPSITGNTFIGTLAFSPAYAGIRVGDPDGTWRDPASPVATHVYIASEGARGNAFFGIADDSAGLAPPPPRNFRTVFVNGVGNQFYMIRTEANSLIHFGSEARNNQVYGNSKRVAWLDEAWLDEDPAPPNRVYIAGAYESMRRTPGLPPSGNLAATSEQVREELLFWTA